MKYKLKKKYKLYSSMHKYCMQFQIYNIQFHIECMRLQNYITNRDLCTAGNYLNLQNIQFYMKYTLQSQFHRHMLCNLALRLNNYNKLNYLYKILIHTIGIMTLMYKFGMEEYIFCISLIHLDLDKSHQCNRNNIMLNYNIGIPLDMNRMSYYLIELLNKTLLNILDKLIQKCRLSKHTYLQSKECISLKNSNNSLKYNLNKLLEYISYKMLEERRKYYTHVQLN